MKITQTEIELWLDGQLDASTDAALLLALNQAPTGSELAQQIATVRAQQALRQTALAEYAPTPAEGQYLATRWLEQFHRDEQGTNLSFIESAHRRGLVKTIGTWAAAAAAVAFVSFSSFFLGLIVGEPQRPPVAQSGYVVDVRTSDGQTVRREFNTLDEAKDYALKAQEAPADHEELLLAAGGVF